MQYPRKNSAFVHHGLIDTIAAAPAISFTVLILQQMLYL
jgi:hypothetical protein